jgi:hypothetical protein
VATNGTRKTRRPAAPKAVSAAPAKGTGLSDQELLLAAVALAADGEAVIPWAAYGQVMGQKDEILGVDFEATGSGMSVTVRWDQSGAEDDTMAELAPEEHGNVQVADDGKSGSWDTGSTHVAWNEPEHANI